MPPVLHERPTSQLATVSVEQLVGRSVQSPDPIEERSRRQTTQMKTAELLDLIDQTLPEEGVVDLSTIEGPSRPARAETNKHITSRAPSQSGNERATSRMPPLAAGAYDLEEAPVVQAPVVEVIVPPRANRAWLFAGIASVVLASVAVLAML